MKPVCVGAALLSLALVSAAEAATSSVSSDSRRSAAAFTYATGGTTPPYGYVDFCRRYPQDCRGGRSGADKMPLSAVRWQELVSINNAVNALIQPISDADLYGVIEHWAYPADKQGDCEDYVLEKQRRLLARGWPPSTLLITVVRDENGEGHAVLTVRTSKGDFVLDNKHSNIMLWHRTPYDYVKRQSARDPVDWVSLMPSAGDGNVATSGGEAER